MKNSRAIQSNGTENPRFTGEHDHCYHPFRGPIHMVVPDGHIVEQCCTCKDMRTIHQDHATKLPLGEGRRRKRA